MHLLDNEFARRIDATRVVTRDEPLRVRWTLEDLVASDGHRVRCAFACGVRAVNDASERRMLAEALLQSRAAAFEADVAAHFEPALRDARGRALAPRPAPDLVSDAGRQTLADALKAAAKPVAFGCGVEVIPPFDVQVDSPSLQEQRLRSMQRALAEEQAAGQIEQIEQAGELLKRFQAIRQAAPELSAGHVLQQVSPADRGALLQTLLRASAKEARQDLWAVAGPFLVRLDFEASGSARHELIALPQTLGPLRSVQPADVDGRRVLLVGARSGFLVVDPANPNAAQAYADPEVTSQLGFSRVVDLGPGRGYCACHGEAGVVFWGIGETERPRRAIRVAELPVSSPAPESGASGSQRTAGPRNLQALSGGAIVYSVGSRTVFTGADGKSRVPPPQSPADVIGIVPAGERVTVIHEDGTVCAADCATLEMTSEKRAGRVRAAAALPWLGASRLLLATEEGPVFCVGPDDDLVTQYASPHRGLRILAASAERVVGVSADRQRLIVWNSWDGRKPATEIYLAGIARHRVADVEFG
jgi:hypothetical protein